MRFLRPLAFLLLLLVLSVTPSAEAGLISKHEFQVGLEVVQFEQGREQNMTDIGLTLMTGQIDGRGERAGLYGFVNTRTATFSGVEKVEVINPRDQQGAIQRAMAQQCTSAETCLVEKTWTKPTVSVLSNSTLLLYANNTALNHTESAPFGLALLVQPPQDLARGALGALDVNQSALLLGEHLSSRGVMKGSGGDLYAVLPNNASSITLISGNESRSYGSGELIFRFYGPTAYDVEAAGILVPFRGDSELVFTPSPGNILRDQFNLAAVNNVFASLGSNGTVVPDEVASNFAQIAPILNGVLFGAAAAPIIDEETRDDAALALIRFGRTTVRPAEGGGAIATGRTDFLMMGSNGFYTEKTGTSLGYLRIPTLSWILWGLAVAAIVAGFALKPIVAPGQVGAFGAVRLVGVLFHVLAFVLAFLLWDFEIRGWLGTSLVTIFTAGQMGSGVVLAVTALFQLVPFFAAGFLFGLPVRFLVNSTLKLGGLKKAGGIGKGIGDLAIWGLGAPFIPFFLNGVIQPIFDQLQNALP